MAAAVLASLADRSSGSDSPEIASPRRNDDGAVLYAPEPQASGDESPIPIIWDDESGDDESPRPTVPRPVVPRPAPPVADDESDDDEPPRPARNREHVRVRQVTPPELVLLHQGRNGGKTYCPNEDVKKMVALLVASLKKKGKAPVEGVAKAGGRHEIPTDPHEAIAINDANREYGPDNQSLYTLDSIVGGTYDFPIPTFAPVGWKRGQLPSQVEYNNRFTDKWPLKIVDTLLRYVDNIVVAGGAAAAPIFDGKANDVDIFIYGITDKKLLWEKLETIQCVIQHCLAGNDRSEITSTVRMTPGVATFSVHKNKSRYRRARMIPVIKVQVILRAFPSIRSILHGFDVPSCCVAFDGKTTYLTHLAAYAHIYKVNIVEPRYSSTTFASRLVKYFNRGFALGLPNMDPERLKPGTVELKTLTLNVRNGGRYFGSGEVVVASTAEEPLSDYDPDASKKRRGEEWLIESATLNAAVRNAAKEDGKPVVLGGTCRQSHRDNYYKEYRILFNTFHENEPTWLSILPAEILRSELVMRVNSAYRKNRLDIMKLVDFMGMSPLEIGILTMTLASNANRNISLVPILQPIIDRIVARYKARPPKVDWWITVDPSRQYTVSLNPTVTDLQDWYKDAYAAVVRPPSKEEFTDILKAIVGDRALSGNIISPSRREDDCSLCLAPLTDKNVIVTSCGHGFHAGKQDGCGGLIHWLETNSGCPICRGNVKRQARTSNRDSDDDDDDYDSDDEERPRTAAASRAVVPMIDWAELERSGLSNVVNELMAAVAAGAATAPAAVPAAPAAALAEGSSAGIRSIADRVADLVARGMSVSVTRSNGVFRLQANNQ
jgi:hypothetical protein